MPDDIDVPALTELILSALQAKGLELIDARDAPNKDRGRQDLRDHRACELAAGIITQIVQE